MSVGAWIRWKLIGFAFPLARIFLREITLFGMKCFIYRLNELPLLLLGNKWWSQTSIRWQIFTFFPNIKGLQSCYANKKISNKMYFRRGSGLRCKTPHLMMEAQLRLGQLETQCLRFGGFSDSVAASRKN